MAVSTNILCMLVFCALLLEKGLSRPSRDEEAIDDVFDEYPNDDENGNSSEYTGEVEEEYTGPPPQFTSVSTNFEAEPGETVKLPCKFKFPDTAGNVTNAVKPLVMWINGTSTLYLQETKISADPRISLEGEYLVLRNVNPDDSGRYMCQLSSSAVVNLTHTLNVFHPAKIVKISPRKVDVVLNEGESLFLSCQAKGYPKPTIVWSRKDKAMPGGSHSISKENVTYERVTSEHSGTYRCTAANKYTPADAKDVNVVVHFAPKVSVENETVISGEEYESKLLCKVAAKPRAHVHWIKDNAPVEQSDRVKLTHEGNMYKLIIDKTQSSDFGDYTCRASNDLGSAEKVVRLTRQPSKPQLTNHALEDGGNSIMFEWTLESFAPISQYELQFRNKLTDEWKKEFPEVTNAEGNVYTVKHKLHSQPPGEYEAILISKNNFGESKSDPHTFQLTHKIGIAEPREATMEYLRKSYEVSLTKPNTGSTLPRLSALLVTFTACIIFL